MTIDVKDQVRRYAEHVDAMVPTLTVDEIVSAAVPPEAVIPAPRRWKPVTVVAVAFVVVLLAVGVVGFLPRADQPEVTDEPSPPSSTVVTTLPQAGEPEVVDEQAARPSTVATTTPGYVWSQSTLPPTQFSSQSEIWGVAHTDSHFVAVGRVDSDCVQVWVSPDGAGWEGAPAHGGGVSVPCRAVLHDVASNGRATVAVGQKEEVPAIWASQDGYDWDLFGYSEPPFVEGDEMRSVAGSELGFVAAGSFLWFSPDGQTWNETTVPPIEWIADVTDGPDGFIAVGSLPESVSVLGRQWSSANAVLHSADGQTWTVAAELEGSFQAGDECWIAANAVTYGPKGYVIAGDCTSEDAEVAYSSMWTSDDGLTWTQVRFDQAAFGEPAYITSITADAYGYLAAGWSLGETDDRATLWFSEDGDSWTRSPIPGEGSHGIHAVAVHGDTAVAVGQDESRPAIWLGTRQ